MAKAVMGVLMSLDGSIAGGTMIPSIPSAGMVESIVLDWYFIGDTRMRGPCSNPGGPDRQIVARMFQAGSSDA